MFTGIVQAVGQITGLDRGNLELHAPQDFLAGPLQLGESIAVNGCCLTLVGSEPALMFNLSEETLGRTTFGELGVGARVNLERAMRPLDRFGGHIVQGHIDAVGKLIAIRQANNCRLLRFSVPAGGSRYLIDKGSIAIDGVSLTVIEPQHDEFDVSIIPHTWAHTSMHDWQAGQMVNLEYDVLAKYVERLMPGASG